MSETTYWDYIKVEELLSLQGGLAEDEARIGDDEHLFITVHQVYELWFKLLLRELVAVRDALRADPVPEPRISEGCRRLRRCCEILRVAEGHFRIIETLTTRDYLEFRDKLFPASGFQSAQLREIEVLMGLPDSERIPFGGQDSWKAALRHRDGSPSPALARIERRILDRPTLREVVDEWLYRTPIQGSSPKPEGDGARDWEVVRGFLESVLTGHEQVVAAQLQAARSRGDSAAELQEWEALTQRQLGAARAFLLPADDEADSPKARRRARIRAAALFISSYRELPLLAWPRQMLDELLAMEQHLLIFRQRHARMVERVIGRRVGTGGSAGVAYLDKTALDYRIFKDLWAVRTLLLSNAQLPPVAQPERYGFSS